MIRSVYCGRESEDEDSIIVDMSSFCLSRPRDGKHTYWQERKFSSEAMIV